MIKCFQLEN